MDITSLVLPSPDPRRLAMFYRETLRLPTTEVGDGVFEVMAGHSVLRVIAGPRLPGAHHLAFAIPTAKFASAKAWLGARTELLTREGQDEFEFEPPFGPARSVYFSDPDGTVLELIARRWPTPSEGDDFDPVGDIGGLAEIAVPVTSVRAAVEHLAQRLDLQAVLDGEEFAAVGDARGMFILVTPERAWFPTNDRVPNPAPLAIDITTSGNSDGSSVRFSNHTVATLRSQR